MRTVLRAMGQSLSQSVLTSSQIEEQLSPLYQRLKLPEGRLELMSGIKERRVWPLGSRPSDLASQAAKNLFENESINKDEIDLLIHASVCRDFLEPATASVIHANLELNPKTAFFDLSNACLGMLSAAEMAMSLIQAGTHRQVLIVSGENATPLLQKTIEVMNTNPELNRKNIKKYIASLTIGSGAVAWLLSREDLAPDKPYFVATTSMVDSSANHLCQGHGNTQELLMETDSEALLEYGVRLARLCFLDLRAKLPKPLEMVIGHQVGEAHERAIMGALELDQLETHKTYPFLGNTGSAALPLTLMDWALHHRKNQNPLIGLLGIGSGLASTMMALQWR
jgi:acyl-CoA:acyl-CoA alkyltransferase